MSEALEAAKYLKELQDEDIKSIKASLSCHDNTFNVQALWFQDGQCVAIYKMFFYCKFSFNGVLYEVNSEVDMRDLNALDNNDFGQLILDKLLKRISEIIMDNHIRPMISKYRNTSINTL